MLTDFPLLLSPPQDAHEFLCSLLEQVQGEALAAQTARSGQKDLPISGVACPATRSFSLAVRHDLTCTKCGERSSVLVRPIATLVITAVET